MLVAPGAIWKLGEDRATGIERMSSVLHLLARLGLAFEGSMAIQAPGTRRIYFNAGFDVLGALLAERAGRAFIHELTARVLAPLGSTRQAFDERPSQGFHGPLVDLSALAIGLPDPHWSAARPCR